MRVGENPWGQGCSFLFELFASRKTTVNLYQAPEMRQLKRFSKNGIYAVSEYLDMLRKI